MTVEHLGARKGQSVVSIATDILGAAQRGELKMLAIACTYADGDTGFVVSAGDEFSKLLGSVAIMQHEMLKAHTE